MNRERERERGKDSTIFYLFEREKDVEKVRVLRLLLLQFMG